MIETEYRLEASRSVVLNAGGDATALGVGPVQQNERWVVERISVTTTSICTFKVYRGYAITDINQIDGTVTGDLDTSETNIPLQAGEAISFAWIDGTNGSVGTVKIEGKRFVKGRRAY